MTELLAINPLNYDLTIPLRIDIKFPKSEFFLFDLYPVYSCLILEKAIETYSTFLLIAYNCCDFVFK